jgi:CRISPR/Cas system endoribonuclease Cas6 (RAMP superfamily)
MRLTIFFKNNKENNSIKINYRISMLHLVKSIFSKSGMYKKYFNNKMVKPYTYSVYFNNMKLEEDNIKFDNYFILNFSSNNKTLIDNIWKNLNNGLKFKLDNEEYMVD